MSLFDKLKSKSSGNKNYAQMYKETVEANDPDKSFKVLEQWGEVPDRFEDSNFLLVMAALNAITDQPVSDMEMYLKQYRNANPVDASLLSWYRQFASVALITKGHKDLVDQYL